MLDQPLQDLESWVVFFSNAKLPILRQTARRLEDARADIDHISGRDIANIVLQDPLMAVRVLSYIQPLGGKRLRADITNIGNAIMMQGIEPFFNTMSTDLTLEAILKNEPQALLGVLQAVRRMQRASQYAHDWAFLRHEWNIDEVTLAALLHDLPEILLWCFAPKLAMQIRDLQAADKTMRSGVAQQQVLGIRLIDLQLALCSVWNLPDLLKTLMNDANAVVPRVKNVSLAVSLARHSANGWDHHALPDDFAAIEKLLHLDRATLLQRLGIPEEFHPRYLNITLPAENQSPTASSTND